MTSLPANAASLFEQATDWFIRMRAVDATADDLADWLGWIEADPAHRAAFDQVQNVWQLTGAIEALALFAPKEAPASADPAPIPPALAEQARPHPDDFVHALCATARRPRTQARRRRGRRPLHWIGLGLAAGLAAAVVLPGLEPHLARGWYAVTHTAAQRITSEHAEPRAVLLPDGSRAQLGAATGVQLRFTPQQRLVAAGEGEVFYRVRHDVRRPFVVQAGPVTVTAVGTAFTVRNEAGAVSVVVAEGAVDVRSARAQAPLRAAAGQRVRVDQGRLVDDRPEPVENDTGIGWTPGRLLFQDEPLRVVVASLNRYAPKPIVLADPALAELRFTGTVFEGRTDDWVSAAQRLFPVSAEETADRVVLAKRD